MVSKPPSSTDVTAAYIKRTIAASKQGHSDAAEEVLSLFREAVDARLIDGCSPEYRLLAEHLAECFWRYENGATIGEALGINTKRGVGQPKGTRKVDETSYAALMILLARKLGSVAKAITKILEDEQDASGKVIISKSKLEKINASLSPMRQWGHRDLLAMLSPAHRRLFGKTLR